MSQRSRRGKRRQPVDYDEEEETVDDLAYAASFAMMGPPATPTACTTNDEVDHPNAGNKANKTNSEDDNDGDDNEDIDIDESDSDSDDDSEEGPAPDKKDNGEPENDEEEDDDEEDHHEELAKAIAAMEDDVIEEEAEEGISSNKTSHKTKNEVDAYNTPIQELEQHLQFRLTVDEKETTNMQNNKQTKSRQLQASDLKCAGTIKHHMVNDRTVVIESNPPVRGKPLNLLDEGTLLLMADGSSLSNNNNNNNNQNLIPLGRILETFGPVTRPLYTIRLPEPMVHDKPPSAEKKAKDETGSADTPQPNANKDQQSTNGDENVGGNQNPNNENDGNAQTEDAKSSSSTTGNGKKVPPVVDNWGVNGKYSQVLRMAQGNSSSSSVAVYFVEDEAKLIDTDLILRISGKGCDASNFYDEEVSNRDEMYYSDDEKERQAKSSSRRRGGRNQASRQQQQQPSNNNSKPAVVPRGFHQPTVPAGFHAAPPMPPVGFHHPPTAPAAAPSYQSYSNYGYPGPNGPPPPPPPPANRNAHRAPPNHSDAPPAYHY